MNLKEQPIVVIGGKYYHKAKVHLVESKENVSTVPFNVGITLCNDKKLRIGNPVGESESRQHLYITSSEQVNECYKGYAIAFANTNFHPTVINIIVTEKEQCYTDKDGKYSKEFYSIYPIIATTDTNLKIELSAGIKLIRQFKLLPQPSQSFIQKFISEYNQKNFIKDILVEYEVRTDFIDSIDATEGAAYKLKVDKSNCITIRPVKDSWNMEEVMSLMKSSIEEAFIHPETFTDGICLDTNKSINWINTKL